LFPIGTATIWVANAIRITGLILVGTWYSPALAEGTFHSLAGWIALNIVAIALMLISQHLRLFQKRELVSTGNPTVPYLLPVLALIASSMIAGAFTTDGFDRYYPACVVATLLAFSCYFRKYKEMQLTSASWQAIAVGLLVFVGWMGLERFYQAPTNDSVAADALRGMKTFSALAWLAFRVFGSVVTVPLAEELAFRGFLTRRLISRDFQEVMPGQFTWLSFVASSLAFGFMHQRWLAGTLAGMAYALVYYRRGRLGDAVLAHATTNALIAAWVLTTGDWSTWS
jgi:exosortase E/protease (VPEID-CTERM system)